MAFSFDPPRPAPPTTSSPITITLGSASIAWRMASPTAFTIDRERSVATAIRPSRRGRRTARSPPGRGTGSTARTRPRGRLPTRSPPAAPRAPPRRPGPRRGSSPAEPGARRSPAGPASPRRPGISLVRRAVAEERDRDLIRCANACREPRTGGKRDAAADDRVRAEHAAGEVRDVHRASASLAEPVLAAVDLGHHRVEVAALGDAVAVAAVRARDVVVVAQVRADARGDRLLADVHVHEARDLAGPELA